MRLTSTSLIELIIEAVSVSCSYAGTMLRKERATRTRGDRILERDSRVPGWLERGVGSARLGSRATLLKGARRTPSADRADRADDADVGSRRPVGCTTQEGLQSSDIADEGQVRALEHKRRNFRRYSRAHSATRTGVSR